MSGIQVKAEFDACQRMAALYLEEEGGRFRFRVWRQAGCTLTRIFHDEVPVWRIPHDGDSWTPWEHLAELGVRSQRSAYALIPHLTFQ